jgi:hypothetical protein
MCGLSDHHWDHSQGNSRLTAELAPHKVEVVGGSADPIPSVTKKVAQGDSFLLGTGLTVSVIHTPCHTKGHVLYVVSRVQRAADSKQPASSAAAAADTKQPQTAAAAATTASTTAAVAPAPAAAAKPRLAVFTGDTLFTVLHPASL